MTPIADLVEQMLAREMPADMIVAAIRAAEMNRNSGGIPVDFTAEKRRAYDRLRKRHSTGNSTGIPPEDKNALTYLDSKKESKKERGTRISAEWSPSEADVAFALGKGVDRSRIDLEAEKFRNYWSSKAGAAAIKLDWAATWRNWILDAVQRSPPRATNSRQPTEAERMGISREQYMRYIQIGFPPELIGGRNGKA